MDLPNPEPGKLSDEDEISKLPDNILVHILSLLPIKDVLRTSVLSKRWKHLWTCIPNIDFDENVCDMNPGMKASFLNSVGRVLLLHDPSCIQKFRLILDMSVSVSPSTVHSWVSAAIGHKVQELDLSLPFGTLYVLPDSLFVSELLRVFKLEMGVYFKVPSFIRFSNLKALHLGVKFPDDESTERLFSGCTTLEELVLDCCSYQNNKRITISISTLRSLTIYDCPNPPPDYLPDCIVSLSAENLVSLEYTCFLIFDLHICNLSSLTDAYIDVASSLADAHINVTSLMRIEKECQVAIKLLDGIHNVKSLALSTDTLQCLCFEENLQAFLPPFNQLTDLKVIRGTPNTGDQVLMSMLEKSPNVQSLELPEGFHPINFRLLKDPPKCFKTCLKTVSVSYFEGRFFEVLFIKHLLENTKMLESITIFCSENLWADPEKQKEIKQQVQAVPTGSTTCVIEFCKELEFLS